MTSKKEENERDLHPPLRQPFDKIIMAVSPLIIQNGTAITKVTAAKAKALAVRTSVNGSFNGEQGVKTEAGAELAEQLNEETKQRYVKGINLPESLDPYTDSSRQEAWGGDIRHSILRSPRGRSGISCGHQEDQG